ncbi:ABC transporter permease [Mucilaginibacter sp. OK283]|uniref:ABC transporter permease n=1 Tax=Mucilaginibacter sp. OK283 TaxID=1881049 RepID=UPI0008B3A6E6|nr:ABC transporter permease [Mucilaginibacter sp. OK283]SEP40337.1 putative ABC transport system permease protein [Mucilaginibacter sp. OK283]
MKIINLIRLALRALQRNKLRAVLTMLGIIIGVAAVITIGAIGAGSKISIHNSLAGLGSNLITVMPNSNVPGGARLQGANVETLTIKDILAIEKSATYINGISPSSQSKGQAINGSLNWPTTIEGVNSQYLAIKNMSISDGIMFSDRDVRTFAKVCLIGQTVVKNLFPKGVNPLGKIIRFNKIPFQVIGILAVKGQNTFGQDQDDIILSPYTTVQKRVIASIYFGSIYASAKSEALSEAASDEISKILRVTHRLRATEDDDFVIRTQAELIKTLGTITGLLTALLTAIAGISLIIGGIGIMNIMYVSVTERTKEIGLRMSIGARGKDILNQFLIEAIMISITGGVIGIVIGQGLAFIIAKALAWPPVLNESSIIVSFTVCTVIGVFFGYYPALKASKLDPIEALRYE